MCTETQSRNQRRVRGWPESFCTPCTRDRLAAAMRGDGRSPSGYRQAAKPPQTPRLFLKLYGIFTHFLQYLYDFPPDPCHTLEERFTRAGPGIARESPPTMRADSPTGSRAPQRSLGGNPSQTSVCVDLAPGSRTGAMPSGSPAPPEHEGHQKFGLCDSESVDETLA